MKKKKRIRFEEAFSEAPTREEVVTYFLAVLELVKAKRIRVEGDGDYAEVRLIERK